MKKFLSNYKQSIILLSAIILGGILGLILGEKATVLSPLGDLFLNLMFVIIVPIVFTTISTSIAKMKQPKRFGKIMRTIILVIIVTSLIAVIAGVFGTYFVKLVNTEDGENIKSTLEADTQTEDEELSILERTVSAISTDDFTGILSRKNLIAIIVFSIIFGYAMNMAGEKGTPVLNILNSLTEIISNVLKIIMYYAPIGLGAYFAALVGSFGGNIAVGYLKTFIIYTIVTTVFYIVVYTLYAYISAGRKGIKEFWKNAIAPTITALATCSSAAAIPVNIDSTKKIGVSEDIAETMIPLGTNLHKDGSIIGSVFKIMFLVCLFGTNVATFAGVANVLLVSLVATLLVTAVPIGGGTISEMMILTMMGYPVAALPILTIIATIIDPGATALNVVGNTSSAMLTARIVDGKDWMKKESSK